MSTDHEILYKLAPAAEVPEDAWRTRLGWTTAFVGDGSSCITLLTPEQVAGAAEGPAFAGKADIMLLSFTVETMIEEADLKVKFESGAANVYGGPIPYACLHAMPATLKLADGKLVVPPLGKAALAGVLGDQVDVEEDNSSDDDGLEPFDQHRFDEDD